MYGRRKLNAPTTMAFLDIEVLRPQTRKIARPTRPISETISNAEIICHRRNCTIKQCQRAMVESMGTSVIPLRSNVRLR